MQEFFIIQGGAGKRTLSGEVTICGAKNAALKALAASILYDGEITLENVPDIEDVSRMLDILRAMGVDAALKEHHLRVNASKLSSIALMPEISKRLRASIVLTGPILARKGRVQFPHPGGCVIGKRPIDLFVEGYEKMGATIGYTENLYDIRAPKGGLRGTTLFFRVQSVTGTETFMMAATQAKGTTIIKNAAMEPEVVWLADILNKSGARISGAGTPTITIEGGGLLRQMGKPFQVIPDRIEAGSFLILGALAAKTLLIKNVIPEHLDSLIEILEYSGVKIERGENHLTISAPSPRKKLMAVNVRTHEYPGFPTDLQAPLMIFLTQADGESLVFETIFEGRLNYTESLTRMGANIAMMDPHRVLVKGKTPLRGKRMESPDLRAGLAFVIAGIIAHGQSEIYDIYNIDRGYERVEERLRAIGARIERAIEP